MKDGNLYREIQRLTAENEVFQHDCTKAAEALRLLKTKLAAAYNAFDHLMIVCFQHADRTRERDADIKRLRAQIVRHERAIDAYKSDRDSLQVRVEALERLAIAAKEAEPYLLGFGTTAIKRELANLAAAEQEGK
jgi:SMC interacting uncharacterized protein involved in chromosome segregation